MIQRKSLIAWDMIVCAMNIDYVGCLAGWLYCEISNLFIKKSEESRPCQAGPEQCARLWHEKLAGSLALRDGWCAETGRPRARERGETGERCQSSPGLSVSPARWEPFCESWETARPDSEIVRSEKTTQSKHCTEMSQQLLVSQL